MKMCRSKSVLLSLLITGSLGVSQQALAHKLNLFAYAEGDSVSVQGYFADGRKAQNSAVKVFDGSGKVLVEGVTNDQGEYTFKTPQKTDIKIVLNAGMGHQGEFAMSADELGGAGAVSAGRVGAEVSQAATTSLEANNELEATVQRAVNEAIKPLVRELAESRQKTSISELVGAVGYIFGLLGLFAFYKARQGGDAEKGQHRPE